MKPAKSLLVAMLSCLAVESGPVLAQVCQLCAPEAEAAIAAAKAKPISISIETVLDFSTAAHTDAGSGTITIDPRTGMRNLSGLVGLSGPALRGTVTITGQPFAHVVVDMPRSIELSSNEGARATVSDIRSDLSALPIIGADGRLVFSFGGKLTVHDEAAGDFRGRIPITADYQ